MTHVRHDFVVDGVNIMPYSGIKVLPVCFEKKHTVHIFNGVITQLYSILRTLYSLGPLQQALCHNPTRALIWHPSIYLYPMPCHS